VSYTRRFSAKTHIFNLNTAEIILPPGIRYTCSNSFVEGEFIIKPGTLTKINSDGTYLGTWAYEPLIA